MKIKEITPKELVKLKEKETFFLLDVREAHEKTIADIGGDLVPLGELPYKLTEIPKDKKIVVYCRSGGRSAQAVSLIQNELQLENVYNLAGGILRYSDDIDSTIQKY